MNHVIKFFPDKAARFTNDELRAWVSKRHDLARQYFRSGSGISFYLDLACIFGDRFEADPKLPWAGEILKDAALNDNERRRKLYAKARAHLLRQRS